LSKSTANPIVSASREDGAWDAGTIGKRSRIVTEGGYYYFAFEGSTPQPYLSARWSTGLVRSKELTSGWTKCRLNPMLPQTADSMGNDGPELLRLGSTWFLYVRPAHAPGTDRYRLIAKE